MKKKIWVMILCLMITIMFTACSSSKPSSAAKETTSDKKPKSDIVIGFQNGISGTSWRTIMVNDFKEVAEKYKAEGRIKDYYIIQNQTNGDVNEQIAHIRDLIAKKVNVIIVNPNSLTALDGVYEEAQDAGIKVIVAGAPYESKDVLTVAIDYYSWYKAYVEWLVKVSGGKGNAIWITGPDSHPANLEHIRAAKEVLGSTNIVTLAQTSGMWDQTKAKEAAASLIAAYPNIDMVVNQDAMGDGILSAFLDAKRLPKYMFGEFGTAFFKKWKALRDKGADFKAFSQPKPPGIAASALKLAVRISEGKQFKDGVLKGKVGNTYYYPVTTQITDENFEKGWEMIKDKSDDYQMSEYLTEEKADALFK